MLIRRAQPKVLICDDEDTIHLAIKSVLGNEYDIKSARNGDEATAILRNQNFDLVLLDMHMRSEREGLDLIPKILQLQEQIEVICFSGSTDFEIVRDAMKLGATDYVSKDVGADELRHVFAKALEHRSLKSQNLKTQYEVRKAHQGNLLIGTSPAITKIRKQLERARLSPAPVVIFGETGTGKEVVARNLRKIYDDGSLEPFVPVDSSTIQSSVSESVLFGYEKGAFTGAEKTTRGLFEEADGGTIYFDELGNMSLEIQNKLLRVIQEKEVLRIGSSKPLSLDFRVICATNQNLEALVAEGKFKDDLYQRLNVLQIQIPPLRERIEDIKPLLDHFSETLSNGLPVLRFLPETMAVIEAYPFPGNVRELANLVLYLYSMCEESEISPLDLPPKFQNLSATEKTTSQSEYPQNFYQAVEQFEKSFLEKAYTETEGSVSKLASSLGMDRSYLHGKLKKYGIHQPKRTSDSLSTK